jgi:uncharacterized protein (TIGR00251 family)
VITVHLNQDQLLLPVKVTPKGGRDCVLPFAPADIAVKLKVSSPPEDGKANAAVITLLADVLKLQKSRLKIVQGEKSRQKRIAISETTLTEVESLLIRLAQALQTTCEDAFEFKHN